MIQLFDIKKKVKQMKISDKELFSKYSEISQESKEKILENYKTKEKGLIQSRI